MNGAPVTHPDAATLGAYHDGELRGFARAELEAHLGTCPRCRRELRALDALADALRALPTVEPPEDVHEAVLARVAGLRPRRPRRTRRTRWQVAAAVAALAALIGGYDALVTSHAGPAFLGAVPRPAMTSSDHAAPLARSYASQGTAGSASSQAAAPAHAPASAVRAPRAPMPGFAAPGSTKGPSGAAPAPTDARLIVRVGEVDLQVPNVQRAFAAAGAIAVREGGYVAGSNNDAAGATSGTYAATLTLRVPAANYQAAVDRLAALPHVKLTERSSSQDITDSYHDLQASLQALQATRAQLLGLMRRARNVRDAMAVLDRLTEVNTSIDSVQSQIMASANSVMLSTITVNLAPEPHKQQVIVGPGWRPGRDLAGAIDNVRRAVQSIVTVVIYAVVYLALPALLAGLALLTRRLWRRAPGNP